MARRRRWTISSQHRLISQHAGTPQVAAGALLVQELMTP